MRPPTKNNITQGKHGQFNAIDYSSSPDATIYAPESGKITSYGASGSCGNRLELTAGSNRHGFCHLEKSWVSVGQQVSKGQPIGVMGYTGYTIPSGPSGRHLHWVIYRNGVYVYPPSLITEPFDAPKYNMPAVNTTIQLIPQDTRTVFHPGSTVPSGKINVTDNTFYYTVRYVRGNRIGIYTKSGGSKHATDYKELALFYTNSTRIEGWKQL